MQGRDLTLKRQIAHLQKKLSAIGPMMRGSVVLLKVNCGNKKCQCYKNNRLKHPAYYFSMNVNNKTKLIYLGKRKLDIARAFNDNYNKAWDIINKLSLIALRYIKNLQI